MPEDTHVHIHIHVETPTGPTAGEAIIIQKLQAMESTMTASNEALDRLTAGVAALGVRLTEDSQHQRDVIAELRAIIDQMAATATDDQATIADLTARADELMAQDATNAAKIDEATATLNSIDIDTEFPPAPPVEPTE